MAAMLLLGLTAIANEINEVYNLNLSEKKAIDIPESPRRVRLDDYDNLLMEACRSPQKKTITIKSIELSEFRSHNCTSQ